MKQASYVIGFFAIFTGIFIPNTAFLNTSYRITTTQNRKLSLISQIPKMANTYVEGPPLSSKPDYSSSHGPLGKMMDNFFLLIFRVQFAKRMGIDSKLPRTDFEGIIELTNALNARYSDKETVQKACIDIIKSIFPPWFCMFFVIFFARPFPKFAAKFLAFMVRIFGTWLMGESEVNSFEIHPPFTKQKTTYDRDENKTVLLPPAIAKNQGVLVKRCRILEESKCASVCINSCKLPTQTFFQTYMGMNLTMTPNYETGECQFKFGISASQEEEEFLLNTPCYSMCPSGGKLRKKHTINLKNVNECDENRNNSMKSVMDG